MRLLLVLALLMLALASPVLAEEARSAPTDEIFVLDNEYVVRGRVVRETDDKLVVRLSGLLERNTVTLRRSEIRKRYLQEDPGATPVARLQDVDAPVRATFDGPVGAPRTTRYEVDGRTARGDRSRRLPADEPGLKREGFGARLVRVTRLAFPASLEGRLLVGFLALLALSVIVGGGARMLGMKALSLHASTTLGFLLGVFLLGDILLHDELLRADRALWVLPLQTGIWIATARALLEAPLSRIVPLFSMVLFASTCLVFLTGSLLVSL